MRPRFQFSLTTVLVVTAGAALLCSYVGWQANIVRDRLVELDGISKKFNVVLDAGDTRGDIPWIRRILGDKSVAEIDMRNPTDAEDERVREFFPEAERLLQYGPPPSPVDAPVRERSEK